VKEFDQAAVQGESTEVSAGVSKVKRLSLILATACVVAWIFFDLVREFIANDTVRYFSSEPLRLLTVFIIAVAGGLTAYAFDRLPGGFQRYLKLVGLGFAAIGLTTFVGWLAYEFAVSLTPINPRVTYSIGNQWVYITLFIFAAIAIYLWFEFYRTLRRHFIAKGAMTKRDGKMC